MIRFEPIDIMIKKIPIPIFAVALAQCALGNLMALQGWPTFSYWLFGILGTISMLLFLLKLIMYPHMVKEDITTSPVLASVSAGAFMALMQIATYIKVFNFTVAQLIWIAAVLGHSILIIWFTWCYVIKQHTPEQFYPTYFLVYAGIAVASLTSSQFNMLDLGRLIFVISTILFTLSFILVVRRYFLVEPIPAGFKPFFCLFTAPPSLFLASWTAVFPSNSEFAIFSFLFIAQVFFLMVIIYVPRLFKIKFFPSYAALGFPFVITAFAFQQTLNRLAAINCSYPSWLSYLAYAEFIFCTIAVVYVTIWYVSYIINYCMICHGAQQLH